MPGYQRILLKVSGEALAGGATFGIDAERVKSLAREVGDVAAAGVQVGLVVGGGNIFRGLSAAAQKMHHVAEPYIRRRAIRHLEKGRIVIFAAGTSNPYFSTDTAATLRALEIKA